MRPVVSSRSHRAPDDHHRPLPRPLRDDPFAELVRRVAADADNPFNIERYLWVLDQPPPRACDTCAALFDPWVDHAGGPGRGVVRRYCSTRCADRAAWARRRARHQRRGERWGSAA